MALHVKLGKETRAADSTREALDDGTVVQDAWRIMDKVGSLARPPRECACEPKNPTVHWERTCPLAVELDLY